MTKWEYIIARGKISDELAKACYEDYTILEHEQQAWLNHYGEDGWEIVTSSGFNYEWIATFKRPMES